ncbi:MAG: VanW family protein [Armatimonadota bacterium]|nr:VanW family protein [Armatimonadota bacterium]
MAENIGVVAGNRKPFGLVGRPSDTGKKILKWSAWLSGPVILASVLVAGFLYLTAPLRGEGVARGVTAAGVDLSGLTVADASARLKQSLPSLDTAQVRATAEGQEIKDSAAHFGAVWNVHDAVTAAYSVGRDGSVWSELGALRKVASDGKHLQVPINIDHDRIVSMLQPLAQKIAKQPRNAAVEVENAGSRSASVRIRRHAQMGVKLDVSGSAEAIASAIEQKPGAKEVSVELPVYHTDPAVTNDMVSHINGVIGRYSTNYHTYQVGRSHNLHLAADAIDGTMIMPGQVFSYNETVGRRTSRKGYQPAPIFLNGTVVDDTGGGVCQVATTLYNAALLANCRIVERNHHSMKTSYIQPGRDATVSWGSLDFKFRNSHDYPILIKSAIGGGELTFWIYGHQTGERVRVSAHDVSGGIITYRDIVEPDGRAKHQVVSRDPYPAAETALVSR